MGDSIKVVDDNYIRRIHSSNTSGKLHKGVLRQESFNADPKTFSFNQGPVGGAIFVASYLLLIFRVEQLVTSTI